MKFSMKFPHSSLVSSSILTSLSLRKNTLAFCCHMDLVSRRTSLLYYVQTLYSIFNVRKMSSVSLSLVLSASPLFSLCRRQITVQCAVKYANNVCLSSLKVCSVPGPVKLCSNEQTIAASS